MTSMPNDSLRILFVDDEEDIRRIAFLALSRVGGHQVVVASSGEAALNLLEKTRDFDVILLDVMMPGLDGRRTLGGIRAAGIDLPVIFITALVREGDLSLNLAAGALGTIPKPFDPMTLGAQVRDFLR